MIFLISPKMKIPLILTVLILTCGVAISWFQREKLSLEKQRTSQLELEAKLAGIELKNPPVAISPSRVQRENRVAEVTKIGDRLMVLMNELQDAQKNASGRSEDHSQEFELLNLLASLNPAEAQSLMDRLDADLTLLPSVRDNLKEVILRVVISNHPEHALKWVQECALGAGNRESQDRIVRSGLSLWAEKDAVAAAGWAVRKYQEDPDFLSTDLLEKLIKQVGKTQPKLAFELVPKLGISKSPDLVESILSAQDGTEARDEILSGLRDFLGKTQDGALRDSIQKEAMAKLGSKGRADFEGTSRWIEASNFTPEECLAFSRGLEDFPKNPDASQQDSTQTGQWVAWIEKSVPAENRTACIRNLIYKWTENDYQAAGKWLVSAPEGPAKETAIVGYTEAVSPYEPATAAEWAKKLPAGERQTAAFRRIHQFWKNEDPAAAQAFAEEHGFK